MNGKDLTGSDSAIIKALYQNVARGSKENCENRQLEQRVSRAKSQTRHLQNTGTIHFSVSLFSHSAVGNRPF
jgi:hypothetical protein